LHAPDSTTELCLSALAARGWVQDERTMGLLKLLTFPVSVPVSGGKWVLQTIVDEAERRYYDEEAIRSELAEVQREFESGAIDERTLERKEEQLLQRLLDARAHRRSKQT
jgi:hypothetical protein